LCAVLTGAVAAAILAPLVLVSSSGFVASTRATASTSSTIFQPWQAWWFLGHHGPIVRGLFGSIKVGYRTAPAWVGRVSHPLIVALALPLSALFWQLRRRGGGDKAPRQDALNARRHDALDEPRHAGLGSDELGLLALLLLLRCCLDTWDVAYYTLPVLFALLGWEVLVLQRLPLLAFSSTVLAWIDFEWMPNHASADLQAAFFLLWSAPLLVLLALRLYAPETAARLLERARSFSPSASPSEAGGIAALLAPEGPLRRSRSNPWAAR
jgi:hypothetical protein